MEGLSQIIIIISGGFLLLHIMSYTFLLDNNKLAVLMEVIKFILGIMLLYIVNDNSRLISDLMQLTIYCYLFVSLGLTFYFFNKDKIIQQSV